MPLTSVMMSWALNPGFGRRISGGDGSNQNTGLALGAVIVRQVSFQVLNADAKPPTGDLTVLFQLIDNLLRHIDRNREPDSLTTSDDHGVDPDDLTFQVEQGAAAVARIDGCVRLDVIVVRPGTNDASLGADNPGRHGLFQPERAPDGHDPLPDFETVGVSQSHGRQTFFRFDLEQSYIGDRIPPDDLGVEFAFIFKDNFDFIGALNHMVVGDDVSVFVDNETGSLTRLLEFRLVVRSKKPFRMAFKRIVFRKFIPKGPSAGPLVLTVFSTLMWTMAGPTASARLLKFSGTIRTGAFGLALAIKYPDTNSNPVIMTMMIDRVNLSVRVMFLSSLCLVGCRRAVHSNR